MDISAFELGGDVGRTFGSARPSDDGNVYRADYSVPGRIKLLGLKITAQPYGVTGNSNYPDGVILFYNTDQSLLSEFDIISDKRMEIPFAGKWGWNTTSSMMLMDTDGYVLFEDGMSVDSTLRVSGPSPPSASQRNPLNGVRLEVFYIGTRP